MTQLTARFLPRLVTLRFLAVTCPVQRTLTSLGVPRTLAGRVISNFIEEPTGISPSFFTCLSTISNNSAVREGEIPRRFATSLAPGSLILSSIGAGIFQIIVDFLGKSISQ